MRLFYAENIVMPNFTFEQEESKHIKKVLRLKKGDKILLTDGLGYFYEAEIEDDSTKLCQVKILKKEFQAKHKYDLHVAIAPTKNIDRFEWFLEKATEIGIDEITPLVTKNSERKQIKYERLKKVVEAAMKQSYKAHHPILNPLIDFEDFIKKDFSYDIQCMAHCYSGEKQGLKQLLKSEQSVLIMIGPEGDFSIEEVEKASAKNIIPLSLGAYRLRTETAGVASVHAVAFINE